QSLIVLESDRRAGGRGTTTTSTGASARANARSSNAASSTASILAQHSRKTCPAGPPPCATHSGAVARADCRRATRLTSGARAAAWRRLGRGLGAYGREVMVEARGRTWWRKRSSVVCVRIANRRVFISMYWVPSLRILRNFGAPEDVAETLSFRAGRPARPRPVDPTLKLEVSVTSSGAPKFLKIRSACWENAKMNSKKELKELEDNLDKLTACST
ncbi:hypothetical protein DFH06DRAFT_1120656, partial [Mycena polygramma]